MSKPYQIDELMAQTRRLAALYKKTTQQTLPVTHELSRYDAKRLLSLKALHEEEGEAEFIGTSGILENKRVQIKGRILFEGTDETDRVAEVNQESLWDTLLLVLFDEAYEPTQILALERNDLVAHFGVKKGKWPLRLGLCKKLGKIVFLQGAGDESKA